MGIRLTLFALALPILFSCGVRKPVYPMPDTYKKPPVEGYVKGLTQIGIASWYGIEEHNRKAASGERFSKHAYTAAHKTLPMDTVVRVTNLENGRDVIVKINDRGPFIPRRIIDLSYAAAKSIDMIQAGTVKVKVEIISTPSGRSGSYFDPQYTVQAGSYRDSQNARAIKEKLDRNYEKVRVESTDIKGDKYYRVRVGWFSNKRDADRVASQLRRGGYRARVILE